MNKSVILALLILLFGGFIFFIFFFSETKREEIGSFTIIESGRAGDFVYLIVEHNGSSEIEILVLNEKPKKKISFINRNFLIENSSSDDFLPYIKELERLGYEIENEASKDSIFLLLTGAFPINLNISFSANPTVYVGYPNLIYDNNLVKEEWYANLSQENKSKLILINTTPHDINISTREKIYRIIKYQNWSLVNYKNFSLKGKGRKTLYLEAKNGTWLLTYPFFLNEVFPKERIIEGKNEFFPWERPHFLVTVENSKGILKYILEKDGILIEEKNLERVRGKTTFFISPIVKKSGTYILKILDDSGLRDSFIFTIKNIEVKLVKNYGNYFELFVTVDEQPLKEGRITIRLAHSNNSLELPIDNGKVSFQAQLKEGENILLVRVFEFEDEIVIFNNYENPILFYGKYVLLAIFLAALLTITSKLFKKQNYKIIIPDINISLNEEVSITKEELCNIINKINLRFKWEKIPVSIDEITFELENTYVGKKFNPVSVEWALRKLIEENKVESYLNFYQLKGWGNVKKNVLRRLIRDLLISKGKNFNEINEGFKLDNYLISISPKESELENLVIFEHEGDKLEFLNSLSEKEKAELNLKIKNGKIRIITLKELDELL